MRKIGQILFGGAAGLALVLTVGLPVAAQTSYASKGQQKREVRNSIRDAKKVQTDYSESHLDVSAYTFRKGDSGRRFKKGKGRPKMSINEDGTAVEKPKLFPKRMPRAKALKPKRSSKSTQEG